MIDFNKRQAQNIDYDYFANKITDYNYNAIIAFIVKYIWLDSNWLQQYNKEQGENIMIIFYLLMKQNIFFFIIDYVWLDSDWFQQKTSTKHWLWLLCTQNYWL